MESLLSDSRCTDLIGIQCKPDTIASVIGRHLLPTRLRPLFIRKLFGSYYQYLSHYGEISEYNKFLRSIYQLSKSDFQKLRIPNEPHFGGRTVFNYNTDFIHINFGGEGQKGFFQTQDYGNTNGTPDTLQTNDNINTWTYTLFAQADIFFGKGWQASAGLSYNNSFIGIDQDLGSRFVPRNKNFSNELAPRFAISKKITPDILMYASISKGFSPPAVAEMLPSTTSINTDLQPENGISYETGIKSQFF